MFNRSAVRSMGIFSYCQIVIRQMDDRGDIPCAYCAIPLNRDVPELPELEPDADWELLPEYNNSQRNLDHLNNNPDDNEPDNLVACCSDCNHAVGSHDRRGRQRLADRIEDLGMDPARISASVADILAMDLPEKDDPNVVQLAVDWFGARIIQQRRAAARRAGRPYRGPRTIDALREEYEQQGHDEADDDTETPF